MSRLKLEECLSDQMALRDHLHHSWEVLKQKEKQINRHYWKVKRFLNEVNRTIAQVRSECHLDAFGNFQKHKEKEEIDF